MKELKRKSWVFKIAYGLSSEGRIPDQVSRCLLFWRTVFMLLVGWPATMFATFVLMLVLFACGFFWGYRPAVFKSDKRSEPLIPIEHWPTIGGRRIWPIWIILAALAIFQLPPLIGLAIDLLLWHIGLFGMCTVVVLGLVAIFFFGRWFSTTEVYCLFKDHLRDIKEKHCPIIPIESKSSHDG